jgi:taurine dioxygenase
MSRLRSIEVHPLTGRIGAEVTGIDLATTPDRDTVKIIRNALLDWKVLFFRDQHALDPEAQLAFARHFGPVTYAHPTVPGLGGHPEVLDVDAAGGNVAVQWHTDVTFVDRPPFASLLRAVVAPPYGGDTLWANTAAAYDELPAPLRTLADSLDAVHTNQFDYVGSRRHELNAKLRAYADVFTSVNYETLHPLVRVHPETGARSLLLGGFARRIDGLTPRDSDALLRVFAGHIERPENVVRWRWRAGDVAFWDNRTTQHRAIADFGKAPRRLHRVTLAGDVPLGVDGRSGRSLAGDSAAYTPVAA